ncbi:PilW family protein [Niallia endozanthoxylica]|uniref:Prepilin-type N-terminal cleavage/methylation domain-containing protein n=1 Tax=Niallia endozanthoxylica TaxID=2036016 RepID=A0A5J5HSL9_9BACI|nr:prepilin-type N-terminal cleavage/methylation domain-containing protein [Niallia endozanthoxylica]KAA9023143.1 prepilin-type N-terminal cleavage/methylation domain-containing protein [Niallia endozanthoxylica]
MKKILSSQRGITLVEVLATLVIMAIVSGGIYSVFTTGLKLYQKTGIEAQLRDDADYVATMILNEMYNRPPNYIAKYETAEAKGIEMVRYKQKTVNHYIVEETEEKEYRIFIYFENEKFYIEEVDPISEDTIERMELSSDSSRFTTLNGESSSISFTPTSLDSNGNGVHGRIELKLIIGDNSENLSSFLKTKPLKLESSFGF